jgi:hypothetical protein
MRATGYTKLLVVAAVFAGGCAGWWQNGLSAAVACLFLVAGAALWWRGTRRAAEAMTVVDAKAQALRMIRCLPSLDRAGTRPSNEDTPENT